MAVLENIRVVGWWGVVVLIVLSGARHVFRALGWSYCVQRNGAAQLCSSCWDPG